MSDVRMTETSENNTAFKSGNVILHELAEGYAEVNPDKAGGLEAHYFANDFAPGLSSVIQKAYHSQGDKYTSVSITQYVQDGKGSKLETTFGFWPPAPTWLPPVSPKWSHCGPIFRVRSVP